MNAAGGPLRIGDRYERGAAIASGGMATVYLGWLRGAGGFSKTVALKQLHPHLAADARARAGFLDEARLAARIAHPNVVATLDILQEPDGSVYLVLEYVLGETLACVGRLTEPVPPAVACAVIGDVLSGLHAAHEATGPDGVPLGLVHRDVSPQNVIVGADGLARLLDFGVAKAVGRLQATETGQVKGKLAYMAPEQLRNQVDRRSDVFATGIVAWECLTGRRLFDRDEPAAVAHAVEQAAIPPPSRVRPEVPPALDAIVLRALARDPRARFQTAQEMAAAIEELGLRASRSAVAAWLTEVAGVSLREKARAARAPGAVGPATGAAPGQGEATRTVGAPGHDPHAAETVAGVAPPSAFHAVRRRRRGPVLWVGSLAVVLGAGLGVAVTRGRSVAPPAGPVAPPAGAAAAAVEVPAAGSGGLASGGARALESAPGAPPAGHAEVPVTGPPVGSSPGPPGLAAAPVAPAPAASPARRATRPRGRRAAARGEACDPPFWIDVRGIRHPRPECL